MIATLAVDIAFIGIFGIYSDLLSNLYQVYNSKFFLISAADFYLLNVRGLTLVAPLLSRDHYDQSVDSFDTYKIWNCHARCS